MQKYSKTIQNIFLYSVSALYAVILYVFLLETRDFFDVNREMHRSINLIPLHSIIDYLLGEDIGQRSFSLMNVYGNIILFIPLGIYLPMFKGDKRLGINVLWIFLLSLSVEIIQFIFGIGVSDIDDIILNTLGGFIGIAVYKGLLYLLKNENKKRFVITVVSTMMAVLAIFLLSSLQIRVR